jgi:hypothetical protein
VTHPLESDGQLRSHSTTADDDDVHGRTSNSARNKKSNCGLDVLLNKNLT